MSDLQSNHEWLTVPPWWFSPSHQVLNIGCDENGIGNVAQVLFKKNSWTIFRSVKSIVNLMQTLGMAQHIYLNPGKERELP